MRVMSRERLLHVDGVVAVYVNFSSQNQECLHQVVGERIIVVDEQYALGHLQALRREFECAAQHGALRHQLVIFRLRRTVRDDVARCGISDSDIFNSY